MAAFAKLYFYDKNPRARVAQVVAKYEGIELEYVPTDPFAAGGLPAEYLAKFPLGLVPALEKGDFKLTESAAIATYLAVQNNKAGLTGSTKEEMASVQQWMAWANAHLLVSLGSWFRPLVGKAPYNKAAVDAAKAKVLKLAEYLETTLADKTYLVGHRITLADIYVASVLTRGFEFILDSAFRTAHPNLFRHYNTVIHQEPFMAVLGGEPALCDKAVVFTPPKKEPAAPKVAAAAAAGAVAAGAVAAGAATKASKAPKAKEPEDDEDDAPAAPKAKHPCESLAAPKSFPLDEWKRQYSNNETDVAVKWLDGNYDPQDYSMWKVAYKYPEELTQVFMSANLITGFHNRLEASRKYLFGSGGVYGENNNNKIVGVYMIRGADYKSVFDVAPDYESYDYTPLDFKKDREFIEGCWAWTNEVDGLKHADGKIFK